MILASIGWFLYCLDKENNPNKILLGPDGASDGDLQYDLDGDLHRLDSLKSCLN